MLKKISKLKCSVELKLAEKRRDQYFKESLTSSKMVAKSPTTFLKETQGVSFTVYDTIEKTSLTITRMTTEKGRPSILIEKHKKYDSLFPKLIERKEIVY